MQRCQGHVWLQNFIAVPCRLVLGLKGTGVMFKEDHKINVISKVAYQDCLKTYTYVLPSNLGTGRLKCDLSNLHFQNAPSLPNHLLGALAAGRILKMKIA